MAKDPYKYFRIEARELIDGLGQGLLDLEKGTGGRDLANRLLRLAHTLKGAARVVRHGELAELAHRFEDLFIPHREADHPIPRATVDELFTLVDRMGQAQASLGGTEPFEGPRPDAEGPDDSFQTIRVPVPEVDVLLERIGEAGIGLAAFREGLAELREAGSALRSLGDLLTGNAEGGAATLRARALALKAKRVLEEARRDLSHRAERAGEEIDGARVALHRMRLLPVSAMFASLERAVRDAARSLGKEIRFETSGGEHRLDAHVLAGVQEALLHLVRNAAAHGIEASGDRVAAGKAPAGLVQVLVERRGRRLAFICQDDGRGFDLDRIRHAALRCRLVSHSEAAPLDLEQALRLFLRGGVSTSEVADEISGRGIGMEAVGAALARLKGELSARSEAGRGSRVEACVPISLASIPALLVEAEGQAVTLPMDAVRSAMRVASADLIHSSEGRSVPYLDRVIPFLPLAVLLERPSAQEARREVWSTLVVQSDGIPVAVGVDRILGTSDVVMKPLPPSVGPVRGLAGASFDAAGNPQLLLDPAGVVEQVFARRGTQGPPTPYDPPRVLVVDDSLTTRMLEQSILESAGYAVDVASSGEEGLRRAKEQAYRIMLVDVEMPGMDGFEFIARAGGDPQLSHVPCILVTSRDAPEDKRRGESAGARGYIVKSEFEESGFLRKIEDLVR